MAKHIQAIRGMHDILPARMPYWQQLEQTIKNILMNYGYAEIRLPVVEKTDLFLRSIGKVTDIVEKEMYSFEDRNGDNLSLRPEGTAGCVRAAIENGLLHNQTQKLWYFGPMFRHERPQKGRYRQFYQFGVEAFGFEGPELDAELLFLTHRLWTNLGLLPHLKLQINSLGTPECRASYRALLVAYLAKHEADLDEDSQRRLTTNPLRVLDSKNTQTQEIVKHAPRLLEHLDEESQRHFATLKNLLDKTGIEYEVNPSLVRGLDYYTRTVFEWVTDKLGAQGTVCAGGRFDGLVTQLGGRATPAAGFAMGAERLISLLEETQASPPTTTPDCYLAMVGAGTQEAGMVLIEQIRNQIPKLSVLQNLNGGSFKAQMKRADKSGAHWALLLGESELENKQITIKALRETAEQRTISQDELTDFLKSQLE